MWRYPKLGLKPLRTQRRYWTTISSSGAPTPVQSVGSACRQPAHAACVPTASSRASAASRLRGSAVSIQVRRLHVDDVDEIPVLHDRIEDVARIREIVQSNSPLSLSPSERTELQETLHRVLDGPASKRFLYASLDCCPMYTAAHAHLPPKERYARNRLCVVYVSTDDSFFGQFRNKWEQLPRMYVLDEWLHVYEFMEFHEHLFDGVSFPVRSFAASSDCIIYSDPDFRKLRDSVKDPRSLYPAAFLHSATAAVMNSTFQRGWSKGAFNERDDTTVEQLCNARWLKNILDRSLSGLPPRTSWADFTKEGQEEELVVVEKLKTEFGRTELMLELENWYDWLDILLNVDKVGYPTLFYLRTAFNLLAGNFYSSNIISTPRIHDTADGIEKAAGLLKRFQKPFSMDRRRGRSRPGQDDSSPFRIISPENMMCFTLSGSKLYNLELPTSDEDYCLIFRYPDLRTIIRKLQRKSVDVLDFRAQAARMGDPDLSVIAAWEARKLLTMLLKGAVEWYQILYHEDDLLYEHPLFQELRRNRDKMMSETVIDNFRKFTKSFLHQLDEESPSIPAHKCLYQVFHKLDQVESMIRGEAPRVICTGQDRDFIMKIRKGEMENQHNDLKEEAWKRLRATSVYREEHGPAWRQDSDKDYLVEWLYEVYGLRFSKDKMTGSAFDVLVDGEKAIPDPDNLESLDRQGTVDWHVMSDGIVQV
eukprot:scpid31602/ scgid7078/ 